MRNASHKTPIHIAVETGNYHMVECLLGLGAHIPIGDQFDQGSDSLTPVTTTPLGGTNTSSNSGSLMLHALSSFTNRGHSSNSNSSFFNTALNSISGSFNTKRNSKHRRTQSTVGLQQNVPVAVPPVPSPLIMACMSGSTELVGFLLDHLPDEIVDHVSEIVIDPMTGNTMLATACENGHVELVDFLLSNQYCSVLEKSAFHLDWLPLHYAAASGHHQLTYLLVSKFGADIDATDTIGRTALHHASVNGHWQVVQVLIELGANVSIRDDGSQYPDSNGKLAIDLAIESIYYHRVARAFRNAMAARQQRQQLPPEEQKRQLQHIVKEMPAANEVVRPVDIINRRNSRQGRSRASSSSSQNGASVDTTRGSGSDEIVPETRK